MKIIFLNTWHGELHDELRAYIKKNLNDTAVFCFQEAAQADRAAYDDLLSPTFVSHTAQRQESNGSWYSNVIYIRNDIPVLDKGGLFLTGKEEFHVGIAAHVTLQLANTELTICNVHGMPLPGHKLDTPERLYQSQTIIDAFADKKNVIIGGDFNLLPETRSVRMFTDEYGYQNLITDFDIKTTRNHKAFERYPDNIQYYADYVFVSPTIKVSSFVVPIEVVSDHQPLELTI